MTDLLSLEDQKRIVQETLDCVYKYHTEEIDLLEQYLETLKETRVVRTQNYMLRYYCVHCGWQTEQLVTELPTILLRLYNITPQAYPDTWDFFCRMTPDTYHKKPLHCPVCTCKTFSRIHSRFTGIVPFDQVNTHIEQTLGSYCGSEEKTL